MSESPLAKKLAERNTKIRWEKHNLLLSKLFNNDEFNLSWTEDKAN